MTSSDLAGSPEPIADRLLESGAALILSAFGPAGMILAAAVSFTRSIYDDSQAAAARRALEQRLGSLHDRLARLEASGAAVKITGERAEVLAAAVRDANAKVFSYTDSDKILNQLGISANLYREAVQELDHLGAIAVHLNGNHASGYGGVTVRPAMFVELVGQVVPRAFPELELGEILDVFRRTTNPEWVRREEFEALSIPIPRIQHMLEYLEEQQLLHLDGSADSSERLMFLNAILLPRGRRVLRGDEELR